MSFGDGQNHLLDPATGQSAAAEATIALRANRSSLADGLSTALSVLSPEAAPALLRRYSGAAGYRLDPDGALRRIPA